MVTRVVDGHFIKSQLQCLFNMLKITLLGGDTEVISIYEPAAHKYYEHLIIII